VSEILRKLRSSVALLLQTLDLYGNADTQIHLVLKYRETLRSGVPLPSFRDIGFRVYSQNDEDGILLYVFALIGTANRKLVDIGCGGIFGSNTAS
jgi:hypothetical protein